MDMENTKERFEQMVRLEKVGERGHLTIQYGAASVVLQVQCSDTRVWLSLQEQAAKLRTIIEAAVEDHARFAEKPAPPLAAAQSPHRNLHKILYGLPCAQCGTYFDSEIPACPFCASRQDAAEFAAEPEVSSAITLQ